MVQLSLNRTYQKNQTIGKLTGPGINLVTMELPWLNNEKRKSCIPEGTYKCTPRSSPKYGNHFLVNNVPGRDAILIHVGNFKSDLLGCIAPGLSFSDLNGDGDVDVTSSKTAMKKLLDAFKEGFELKITA